MRYRFIDEILAFDTRAGRRIEVAKMFAPGGDELSGPAGPGRVPNSLMVELLAMTGGRLLFERLEGQRLPLLAKVRAVAFHEAVGPGVPLRAVAEVTGIADVAPGVSSAEIKGEIFAGPRRLTTGTLFYLCVTVPGVDLGALGACP